LSVASGAKAPDLIGCAVGTAEAVPFQNHLYDR
jgi:hypothetical protein